MGCSKCEVVHAKNEPATSPEGRMGGEDEERMPGEIIKGGDLTPRRRMYVLQYYYLLYILVHNEGEKERWRN